MPGKTKPPAYRLYQFLWNSMDWIFPPQCAGCGIEGYRWCPDCQADTQPISGHICTTCGDPIQQANICKDCSITPPNFDQSCSWAEFKGPLRNAILNLKYQRQYGLGGVLISPVIKLINNLAWNIDIIVPVPLGKKRFKERGYNQAGALARPLAWVLQLPYIPNALHRTRETVSQVGLSKIEREKNVLGAFQARSDLVAEKNVLLVDDVWTTGATINACAQALKKVNAKKVFAVTLSRAADTRVY